MLYEILVRGYILVIWLASFFNPKARKWLVGRRDWRGQIAQNFRKKGKTLWLHAASLGEFEQGRPVIEALKKEFPGWQVVLTFFSPSGFEVRKNYPHADFICYLPADTARNARDFIQLIQPDVAVFVKYEFWHNYLTELKKRSTPTLLVSSIFRESQPFFKWYGGFWRRMLGCFSHLFVQDAASKNLLQNIGFQNVTVAGDTRIDRVLAIAESAPDNQIVQNFCRREPRPVLIAGSSWAADEDVFLPLPASLRDKFQLIVAPHEVSEKRVAEIAGRFLGNPASVVRYSRAENHTFTTERLLIIDNIGLLNTIYKYGTVAYIGGGFGAGIHNILEPAAFGLPVIFGPRFQKFEEARQLLARGGAFSVKNAAEFEAVLTKLTDPDFYQKASAAARGWLLENRGATAQILNYLRRTLDG
ncbi:MAG: 3-deoxy-D-manno-octulosonic acid transferase [Saprospiraceae bacterium]